MGEESNEVIKNNNDQFEIEGKANPVQSHIHQLLYDISFFVNHQYPKM